MTLPSSKYQGSTSAGAFERASRFNVGPGIQQCSDDMRIPMHRSEMQRHEACTRWLIRVRVQADERENSREPAALHRNTQRSAPIAILQV
eukprot:CAMPEP_0115471050 /NCGR_PEP_ID=MMETSP0271-20121206/52321_1 /TAXON_ID=71861 /ORGANISM="Scrippsiella trochoidea, Strain CCMP3099" /LENGTH=89 /DNA_ID=CAMNT_0002898219 /DNA_START=291 /DNA_END=560 /DNA_ORIENTATION=-